MAVDKQIVIAIDTHSHLLSFDFRLLSDIGNMQIDKDIMRTGDFQGSGFPGGQFVSLVIEHLGIKGRIKFVIDRNDSEVIKRELDVVDLFGAALDVDCIWRCWMVCSQSLA